MTPLTPEQIEAMITAIGKAADVVLAPICADVGRYVLHPQSCPDMIAELSKEGVTIPAQAFADLYDATHPDKLQAALTAIRQLQNPWMPIETAPRDGSEVLVFNRATGPYVSQYDNGEWPKHGWDNKPGVWYPVPSHWMPLPTPPKG
jgi:hypothetical protein